MSNLEDYLYKKLWRLINIERARASRRSQYQKNKKKELHDTKIWRLNNPEKMKVYHRRSRIKNRVKRLKALRIWRKQNGHKFVEYEAKRRAVKRNALVINRPLIAKIYARAKEFRRWFDVVVDHIIPLSKGGAHSPENLQIIYAYENARKYNDPTHKPRVIFI